MRVRFCGLLSLFIVVAKGLHYLGHTYEGEWPRVGLGGVVAVLLVLCAASADQCS